ncbi:hypothetical protein ACOMHN_046307 [Nucella lapillus]
MMLMVARDNVWTDEKHQLSAGEEAFILVRFLVMLEFYPHICKSSITLFVEVTVELLTGALKSQPDAHFYLVEGFPRNLEQLEDFNKQVWCVACRSPDYFPTR